MKYAFRFITLFILIASLSALNATAAEKEKLSEVPVTVSEISQDDIDATEIDMFRPKIERAPEIGLQLWMTTGHGEWEIEFGTFFFSGRSKLEWDDIDAPVLVLHGEAPINDKFSIGGSIGYGEIDDGTNTDGDWLGDFQFSESQSDSDGDVQLGDLNVYYNMHNESTKDKAVSIDVFLGYQYYKDDLKMKNGVQTVIDERQVNQPFAGLDSSYSFEWQMLRIGARGALAIDDNVTFGGSLAYLLLIDYDGEAFWNLREDFRRTDPNFTHSASSGYGLEGKATIRIKVADNLYVDGGYWFIVMNAEDGTDTTYFSDGTQDSGPLKEVQTIRQGAFGGILYEF